MARPVMTIKHARLEFNPARITYETYRNFRTGKRHNWVIPDNYVEEFAQILENNFDLLVKLQSEEGVNLSVWSEPRLYNGRELHYWYSIEEENCKRDWLTEKIDRNCYPKLTDHKNDNEPDDL